MKYNCETFKNILNGNIYNVQWLENTLQDINFSHIETINEIISQLLSQEVMKGWLIIILLIS